MTSAPVSSLGAAALPWLAVTLWVAGSLLVLGTWWVRWRRVAAIARAASIVECGDEVDTLRRVERRVGVRRPIALVASDAAMEPGVFGILRPVLLWSGTIGRHLNGEQVETIFAHELSHVRRRDNLAAAIHMVVEAMLWFHPLVWWIGTRLVDERERACDEAVLVSGHRPEVYAESILKACRLYVESPLPCVAGVTGSDLRKRIERIMSNSTTERLTRWRRLLLTACVLAPLAAPVLLGAASTPRKRVEISSVRMFGLNAPAAAARVAGRSDAIVTTIRGRVHQAEQVKRRTCDDRRPARRTVHRHQRHVEDADSERLPAAGLPDRRRARLDVVRSFRRCRQGRRWRRHRRSLPRRESRASRAAAS